MTLPFDRLRALSLRTEVALLWITPQRTGLNAVEWVKEDSDHEEKRYHFVSCLGSGMGALKNVSIMGTAQSDRCMGKKWSEPGSTASCA